MAAYTDIDLDFLRQFCDIREVKSLAEFLLPGYSLCIIHGPEWREFRERENVRTSKTVTTGGCVRLVTVRGHNRQGKQDELLLGICGPEDQGYYRHKLDKNLESPFLFTTWKRGDHEFRLIQEKHTTACFPSLDEALAAYLPDGFIPECSLEDKWSTSEHVFDPDCLYIGDGVIE